MELPELIVNENIVNNIGVVFVNSRINIKSGTIL